MNAPKPSVLFVVATLTGCLFLERASAEGTVLGWSSDGGLWAFMEEGDYGEGAMADYRVEINVIDSLTNRFKQRFNKKINEENSSDPQPELLEPFKSESLAAIRDLGVTGIPGNVVYQAPVSVQPRYSEVIQSGLKLVAFAEGSDRFELKLEDRYISDEDKSAVSPENPDLMSWGLPVKSGFTLSIRKNEGTWKVLQTDKAAHRNFRGYRIHHVSLAPQGDTLAVLIEAVESGFENHKTLYYLGVTGQKP